MWPSTSKENPDWDAIVRDLDGVGKKLDELELQEASQSAPSANEFLGANKRARTQGSGGPETASKAVKGARGAKGPTPKSFPCTWEVSPTYPRVCPQGIEC